MSDTIEITVDGEVNVNHVSHLLGGNVPMRVIGPRDMVETRDVIETREVVVSITPVLDDEGKETGEATVETGTQDVVVGTEVVRRWVDTVVRAEGVTERELRAAIAKQDLNWQPPPPPPPPDPLAPLRDKVAKVQAGPVRDALAALVDALGP
jgi:hypothetical protein